jgi:hypothetical protein
MYKYPFIHEEEVNMNPEKQIIRVEYYTKRYNYLVDYISASDLPSDLQPTDLITIIKDDGYYSENDSWDAFSELVVMRPRLETDEEQSERLRKSKEFLEERKKDRYQTYLNLKKEFEKNENT